MKKSAMFAVLFAGIASLFAEEAKKPDMADGFENVYKNEAGTPKNDDWRINNSAFMPKDGTYAIVTDAKSGKYALQLTANGDGKGYGVYGGGLPVIVTPESKVDISFWAKGKGAVNVGFNGYDSQNKWVGGSTVVSEMKLDSENEWKEQKVQLVVPAISAIGYIFIIFELKPGSSAILDAVSVTVAKKEDGK